MVAVSSGLVGASADEPVRLLSGEPGDDLAGLGAFMLTVVALGTVSEAGFRTVLIEASDAWLVVSTSAGGLLFLAKAAVNFGESGTIDALKEGV